MYLFCTKYDIIRFVRVPEVLSAYPAGKDAMAIPEARMYINNNISAMFAHRQYNSHADNFAKSIQRLSSGYRINSAADDPAGLAISEKMRAQIRGTRTASKNCQDAISLLQTAEGSLQTVHDILQRMNELSIQSASDTNEDIIDRKALNEEFQQLAKELSDIFGGASFNDKKLFDGSSIVVQSGPNSYDKLNISIPQSNLSFLGLDGLDILTRINASASIENIKNAININSTNRANLGALTNRLEHKINYLDIMEENLTEAESRIRDVDMAKEISNMVKEQLLMQSSLAVLAQANKSSQMVLNLLSF